MDKKTILAGAALGALAFAACRPTNGGGQEGSKTDPGSTGAAVASNAKGRCWGVNACKGQGQCDGAGHSCAGANACKGQGWLQLAKADCDAKNGKFKEGGHGQ